jgi:hypothetical protein
MELAQVYIRICTEDPLRMRGVISRTNRDIEKIIQVYKGDLQISYRLMMDLKEVITNYLIKNDRYHLFNVKLAKVVGEWGSRKLEVDVTFVYNDERQRVMSSGVFHQFDKRK